MSENLKSPFTTVSDRKPIVGLGRSVTIGNHVSAEISMTRHSGHLKKLPLVRNIYLPRIDTVTIAKFAQSAPEYVFCISNIVNSFKIQKDGVIYIHAQ